MTIATVIHFKVATIECTKNKIFEKEYGLFIKDNSIEFSTQSKTPESRARLTKVTLAKLTSSPFLSRLIAIGGATYTTEKAHLGAWHQPIGNPPSPLVMTANRPTRDILHAPVLFVNCAHSCMRKSAEMAPFTRRRALVPERSPPTPGL